MRSRRHAVQERKREREREREERERERRERERREQESKGVTYAHTHKKTERGGVSQSDSSFFDVTYVLKSNVYIV